MRIPTDEEIKHAFAVDQADKRLLLGIRTIGDLTPHLQALLEKDINTMEDYSVYISTFEYVVFRLKKTQQLMNMLSIIEVTPKS